MITRQEFEDRVALLKSKIPSHPLLPTLGVYSPMAVTYLRHAMRSLEGKDNTARPQVLRLGTEEQSEFEDTPEMKAMQRERSTLYGRRASLSNQFHHYLHADKADEVHACANLSDEIRRVQRKIGTLQRRISYYRRTGEVMEEAEEVVREYTGLALSKRYHTVRQNVNRWKKRIDREGATQPDHVQRQWDTKLKEYERECSELQEQIRQETL